jgi:GNAT superfamily N-acetyltransferase
MESYEQALLNNHVAFLSSHRGEVRRKGDTIYIESDRPEFTYAILGHTSRLENLASSTQTIQHLPWSMPTTQDLKGVGFVPTIGISYMVLNNSNLDWRIRDDISIKKVCDDASMDTFSKVQSRGFNESQESYDSWHPWLRAANHRNLANTNQSFYVGSLGGEAVGVVLTVIEGEMAGIYAVATLPKHRKKGVSATIMKQAIADARVRGCSVITLQVKQDSYVEDFYRHLGFKRIFTTGMYRRG